MTSGDEPGTKGPPLAAFAFATLGLVIAAAVNVWTRIHDQPELSASARVWEPIVWEASSAAVALALLTLVWRAVVVIDRATALAAVIARSVGYAVAFFILHVAGFVLLRWGAYAVAGQTYVFGGARSWLYELPKDLVTFVIIGAILLAGKRLTRLPAVIIATPPRVEPLRIRDGSRTLLVMPGDILAASASGNYVEYQLADGRRPLSRGRLIETEALLEPYGFLRTHRSWLVNRAHVHEVRPAGNGDHELAVGADLKVPVSRRFAAKVLKAIY